MNHWNFYRPSVLAIALGGTMLALFWGIRTPLLSRPTVAPFTFPEKVPLSGWKQVTSNALDFPNSHELTAIASRSYQYRSPDGLTLNIQMRYLNTGKADIPNLLHEYTEDPPIAQITHQEGVGAIALGHHQDSLYLSACINPQGPSTVTADQFLRTKLVTGKNGDWFLAWLWGQSNLLDQRCLWSHLSLPVQSRNQNSQKILQDAWQSWFKWWIVHYPSS
jgi:cyanosortase A-associated protein